MPHGEGDFGLHVILLIGAEELRNHNVYTHTKVSVGSSQNSQRRPKETADRPK